MLHFWCHFRIPHSFFFSICCSLWETCDHYLFHTVVCSSSGASENHQHPHTPTLARCSSLCPLFSLSTTAKMKYISHSSVSDTVMPSFWIHFTFSSLREKCPIPNKAQRSKHNLSKKETHVNWCTSCSKVCRNSAPVHLLRSSSKPNYIKSSGTLTGFMFELCPLSKCIPDTKNIFE